VEDSQSEARQALSSFQKLVETDRVRVVIGFVLSDEVLTCAPVANRRKVVLLSTAAGSDKIRDAGDYVFRNRESAATQAEAIARYAIEDSDYRRIGIQRSNSANGVSYANAFRSAAQKFGGTVVCEVGYDEGKTDYRTEIGQLRAKSPPAVYLAGLDQELGIILKQARELGFRPQFFASAGAISAKLLGIAGAGAEGLVCGSAPFDAGSRDPKIRAFAWSFKTRFAEDPDFIAANSYDAVRLLASFFAEGKLSANQIKSALYRTKAYPGVGGVTTFDPFGEVQKPVFLVQVRKGNFTPMEAMPDGRG
jgi:branched-chain amino acid transport system substrate-binding protein